MRRAMVVAALAAGAMLGGCQANELDTRTFELRYMQPHEARSLVSPYVFTDREGSPGTFEVSGGALTVRETADNLAKIERMLEQFDRPRPLIALHFQIIRADGASDSDPAIAEVERELRRLFRFDGYQLVAETRVAVMEGSHIRQLAGGGERFMIEGGISEVRRAGDATTVRVDIQLNTREMPGALQTSVTVPVGHSVVLGTAESQEMGALILVVRAEIAGGGQPPADSMAGAAG